MDNNLAIGIDVGATNTKIGLVESSGKILEHRIIPSELHSQDPALFLNASGAIVSQFLSQRVVKGIGISLCSIINEAKTGVLLSVNAPALAGLNVRQAFEDRFGLPVQVSNDVGAFALAESHYGAGKGMRRVLCLGLGTGLAIAAVIDGCILETWGGISADAARMVLEPNADVHCKAGVRGSAEALCGVANIERLARQAYRREDVSAREVIEASRAGDVLAGQVMAQIGGYAGHLLALLSPIFFPQRILITGGTAEAGDPLFAAVRRRYETLIGDYMTNLAQLDTGKKHPVEILKAALGPEAAVIGAVQGFF
jgi:glucokinase